MLYKGDKGVNDAARPPEGGPAEVGGLSASSLPLQDNVPSDTNAKKPAGVKANNKLMPSASSPGTGRYNAVLTVYIVTLHDCEGCVGYIEKGYFWRWS